MSIKRPCKGHIHMVFMSSNLHVHLMQKTILMSWAYGIIMSDYIVGPDSPIQILMLIN